MAKEIHLKVRRQASPKDKSYWEEFKIPYEPQHNVISVLMKVRENPINTSGLGSQLHGRGLRRLYDHRERRASTGMCDPH